MTAKDIARKARALWSNPDVPASTNRHNRRQWMRSVIHLGPRWTLHHPTNRPPEPGSPSWRNA